MTDWFSFFDQVTLNEHWSPLSGKKNSCQCIIEMASCQLRMPQRVAATSSSKRKFATPFSSHVDNKCSHPRPRALLTRVRSCTKRCCEHARLRRTRRQALYVQRLLQSKASFNPFMQYRSRYHCRCRNTAGDLCSPRQRRSNVRPQLHSLFSSSGAVICSL
jgi:hypothetical protein